MDSRLKAYYARELDHLREVGAQFAREFPKIAGRLSLDEFVCPDPYVERLLEGFAFLTARVHLKLDAEFPRFTQSLLQTVYPQYLSPTPSMCVVEIRPEASDPGLAEGFPVPRNTPLRSITGRGERTACEYRTAHDLKLFPVRVAEAQYYTREIQTLELPEALRWAKAGIRLRLTCPGEKGFGGVKMDALPLFIRGGGDLQMRVYEQIFAHAKAVVVQTPTRPVRWREVIPVTPAGAGVRRVGFDDAQALLPYGPRSFQGYRLLHEYFACPQRFMFFELIGLSKAFRRSTENTLDLIVLLKQPNLDLENSLSAANFVPYCTPAINLFPKRCDRIAVEDRFAEFHVVPDKTRPRDFEVYEITAVEGFGENLTRGKPFLPFYSARDFDQQDAGAYYTSQRVPRMESENELRNGRRSKYGGSEVYLSLVDAKAAPYAPDLRQLGVEALCTNRDLPIFVPTGRDTTDFTPDIGGPIASIHCVSGVPTPPRPSHAEGQTAWRLVSHLSLNYLSLVDPQRGQGAAGLHDLLSLYGDQADPAVRKQIEGIKSVATAPIVRRVPTPGPIAFARGLQETVILDEAHFDGSGAFLLGAVLEQFFAKYVSINSFTETVVRTVERGEIMRWPARFGRRHVL